jgi:hypothetical protein
MELIHAMVDRYKGISVFAGVGERSREGHEMLLDMRNSGVLERPPTPPTEPSAGAERWIGSIKRYRLWLKRRSSCMLQCAHTEADGSAPCKGEHIHDDRRSDRH